jgi:hypothetical protein
MAKWAKAIVNRLMLAWQVDDHKTLAAIVGVHPNTPSNWIQKKTVPWTVIYSCHKSTENSLDWLYDGTQAPLEITASARAKIESSAMTLMSYSEKMGLIKQMRKDGYRSVAKGLTTTVIEAIKPAKNH